MIDTAKFLVPVLTGALRRSITYRPQTSVRSQKDGQRSGLVGVAKPAGSHAHLIEFGHYAVNGTHVAARPFMRPAFDANYAQMLDALGKVLGEAIEKEAIALRKKGPF